MLQIEIWGKVQKSRLERKMQAFVQTKAEKLSEVESALRAAFDRSSVLSGVEEKFEKKKGAG